MGERDPKRALNAKEKAILYQRAGGKCEGCRIDLPKHWHAHHPKPWANGGATTLENSQALCDRCNLWKNVAGEDAGPPPEGWPKKAAFTRNNLERVLAKIEIEESGCWNWTGKVMQSGYGTCMVALRCVRVHRYVYEQLIGRIGGDLIIHHICDNRRCCNPEHLEPVGRHEHAGKEDKAKFGKAQRNRTECIHGHPLSGENLFMTKKGERLCRECGRRRKREWDARQPKDRTPNHSARKTHCVHGHHLAGENLYVSPAGTRHCRTCRLAATERSRKGECERTMPARWNTIDDILRRLAEKPNGYLEWPGTITRGGYGLARLQNKSVMVHRAVWQHDHGSLAPGQVLHHRCGNPACANVEHLEVCPKSEYVKRYYPEAFGKHQREQAHCKHGHPLSGENLYVHATTGMRGCLTCRRERARAWHAAHPKSKRP